jgi:hypothetical protein
MSKTILRARVAAVLDDEQIALKAGSKDGVNVGDRLHILRETPIPDPDEPEVSLGTAFVKKGTFVVDSVEDKFSVARVLRVNRTLLAPAEPMFLITTNPKLDGRERVYIQQGDPVDIVIGEG